MSLQNGVLTAFQNFDLYNYLEAEWTIEAVQNGGCVYKTNLDGKVNINAVESFLHEQGLRTVYQWTKELRKSLLLRSASVVVRVLSDECRLFGTSEEEVSRICKGLLERIEKTLHRNTIYVLAESQDSYSLKRLCAAPVASLIDDNYSSEVIRNFRYLQEELVAPKPRGRIGILTGHPGTGKTYLARALMDHYAPKCDFILLNPNEVTNLAKNARKFLAIRADRPDQTPILILEDADRLLAPRKSDNVSDIQSILNFGDGILGDAFNIRLLITSNVRVPEIDPAILRPGRLIQHIDVGPLAKQHAERVYHRLTGTSRRYTANTSLATIYADAVPQLASAAE